MSIKTIRYVLLWLGLGFSPGWGKVSSKQMDYAKKALVTIACHAPLSAYHTTTSWSGTGYLLDKKRGYILTTKQVTGVAVVGTYRVTFHNGSQAEAHVVYYDPWLDIGFLQVDPTQIPVDVTDIPFSKAPPRLHQPVWTLAHKAPTHYSFHTGRIMNLYTSIGNMPQHTLYIQFDTAGATGGLPVLNKQGEAVALCTQSSGSSGIALHPAYIRDAWQAIAQGQTPVRKHIGVLTQLYSLEDAVRYRNFPKEKWQAYVKKYPASLGQVIQVEQTLSGSPAADTLLPGDLIWAINGREIGPSLVDFDRTMQTTDAACVQITIFRKGVWQEVTVALYDLEASKIQRLVYFGGVVFFQADDYIRRLQGSTAQGVTLCKAHTVITIFDRAYHWGGYHGDLAAFSLQVRAMDEKPIHTLEDLIQQIPDLIKKKDFTLTYINFLCTYARYGTWVSTAKTYKADVAYDAYIQEPRLFMWNPATYTWQMEKIMPVC